jgi:hypothetical protein
MTEASPAVMRVDVPRVSNVIDVGEFLRALRDFAAERAEPAASSGRQAAGPAVADSEQLQTLGQVRDLAAELAELVENIPDLRRSGQAPPPSP